MFEPRDAPEPQPTVQAGSTRARQSTLHRCPNCGAINRGHASICPQCGENLRTKPRRIRCSQCNKQASSVLVICPHCGRELIEAPTPWLRWLIPLLLLFLVVIFLLSQWQALHPFGWAQVQIDKGLALIDRLGANMDPTVVIESTPVAFVAAVITDTTSVAGAETTAGDQLDGAVNTATNELDVSALVTVSQPTVIDSQAVVTDVALAMSTPTDFPLPTAPPEPSATATALETATATPTPAPTQTATEAPTATPIDTATATALPSSTPLPTSSTTATVAPTESAVAVALPTATAVATAAPLPTASPTASVAATPTQTATGSAVRAAAIILLPSPTPTPLGQSSVLTTTQFARATALSVTTSASGQAALSPTVTPTTTPTESPTATTPPTATSAPTATPSPIPQVTYRIQSGDTLSGIAVRYSVSVDALMAANGLSAQDVYALRPGDELTIPGDNGAVATEEPAPASPPTPTTPPRTYTVQAGDIPIAIANRFGISVDALLAANGLTRDDARNLRTGQTLIIPGAGDSPAPLTAAINPPPSSASPGTIRLDPPQLRSPENGADVSCSPGNSMAWLPVNFLGGNDQYLLHLGFVNGIATDGREEIVWVLEQLQSPGNTLWAMDVGLCGLAPQAYGRKWYWYVEVVEVVNGSRQRVSPPSDSWSFRWN